MHAPEKQNAIHAPKVKIQFKVLEVDEEVNEECGYDEVMHIRTVADSVSSVGQHDEAKVPKWAGVRENFDDRKGEWVSLCLGDVIIDSAAGECWLVEQGDAFQTMPRNWKMVQMTASGRDMGHYDQKEVFFECNGGEGKGPIGLTFQVTDVKNPVLSVRRLVERRNKVLSAGTWESYIYNECSKMKVLVKKGCLFVILTHFVKQAKTSGFTQQA